MLTLFRSRTESYYYDEHRRIQGKYRSFSYVTEELLSTITYVDNIRHGEFQTYFDSGEVKMRGTFINDEISGPLIAYFVDNTIREENTYEHGKLHGVTKGYYLNGNMHYNCTYHRGNLHKECIWYDTDGNEEQATYYWHGTDLNIHPSLLTEGDKMYIAMSGRLPLDKCGV